MNCLHIVQVGKTKKYILFDKNKKIMLYLCRLIYSRNLKKHIMNCRLFTIVVLVLGSFTAFSQTNQCFRISGNTGMGFLSYNMSGGSSKPKLSYGGKFGYSYYFSPSWGIGTGVEVSMYNTEGNLDGAVVSFDNQIDDEGDMFRKDVYFRDWHEAQKILFVEVPLLLHYQYDFSINKRRKIYFYVGAKFQLPLMASYAVTRGELEIQGYYEKWNVTLFGLPNHGFGREPYNNSEKLSLPFNISATFGIGFSFEVAKMIDVFLGGAFDYGFMNLKTTNAGDLLYEDINKKLQYRGLLNSSAIEKANTISIQGEVGVRIALGAKTFRSGIYRYNNNRY